MSAWISAADRLPDIGQSVLCCHFYGGEYMDCFVALPVKVRPSGGAVWEADNSGLDAYNYDGGATITVDVEVTHWMPLPEPPNE